MHFKNFFILVLFLLISFTTIGQTAITPQGSGTSADPYLMSSLGNLYWLASENAKGNKFSQNKYFLQTNNIDASDTRNWTHTWIPIGGKNSVTPSDTSDETNQNSNYSFYGTYNGGGYAVDGLVFVNNLSLNSLQGFFGLAGSGSVIINLNITNISITTNSEKTGGLVGYLYRGTIYNCSTTGIINSTNQTVGGLVGQIGGSTTKNSSSSCTVTGLGSVAGLAGINQGTIIDCFSTGNVTGNTNSGTGGLMGQASTGAYYRSYSNNPISTTQNPSSPGGFAGIIRASTANNSFCYWNSDNESDGYNSTAGNFTFTPIGLTTSQLKDISNFDSSWDFVQTWAFGSDGFPTLVNLPNTWLGVDTNWTNTANWSFGVLPSSNFPNAKEFVVIPAGLSNYPSLTGDVTAYSVIIDTGASLTTNSNTLTNTFLFNKNLETNTDSTAPTISSVTANWGDFLTEVEDDVNGTVTVVTSGAEDGQMVTLTLNSLNYTASVSSNSASITVSAAGLQALSNNTDYTLTTNVSDLAGNSAITFTSTTFKALNNPSTNNALAFDGTNDYVAATINLPTGDFTYSAWVKFNTVSRKESIFSVGGDNELIIIKNTDGKLAVWIGGSERIVESSATDTDWHHIALTRSGVNATLYRDGVSVGSSTSVGSGPLSLGSCDLLIASDSDDGCIGSLDDYLDGQIDELRIWNDVRTVSEISTNMISELTGNESNLVGYYKFNEPDTNTVASNFASATGASYDGLLTNMAGTEWTTSTAFASAIETFTNSSGDGQWDTASNWDSGSVPSSSTNVTISSGQTIEAGSNGFNSIRLDGAQNNYLQINNSSGTFQETGDFTFEMWVKINAWDPSGSFGYKASFLGYSQHNFWLSINNSGKPQFRMGCGDLTFNYSATSNTNNWEGNWKHMAIVRDGTTLKFFVDGVEEASKSCSGGTFMNSSTIKIGKNDGWPADLDAWISKIRYVKGSALYSSNFTPPTSLSNVSGTHLLLNVDSQTNAFVDSSDNNHTVSTFGSIDPYFVQANGPSGSGNSTAALANNLTIDSGGSLTVAANSDLTLSGNFTNNGTVTLNSESDEFSSIIVGGSSTGNILYNRYVNTVGTGEWDLIGSPVDGLSISNFVTTNSSVLATNGSAYAVGYHDNSDDSWTNYTTSTVGGAGNFDIARGYQMATSSGATMAFTGSIATIDQTQSIINNNGNGNGGRRWNLIANPFASYLNANSNADATNNFLTVNTAAIDDNFEAIYGWKADGTGYEIYNNTSTATHIAPGQGFFVAAAGSGADQTISFTKAMQTVTGGDDFVTARSSTSYELVLDMHSDNVKVDDTKFYFKEGLTLGLDPGYDAGAFNQSSGFGSRLVEQDNGIGMGINAMSLDAISNAIVPLVINQQANSTLKIEIANSTIPENINVYLEDTVENTFTLLTNGGFELLAQTPLSGVGRFFLHYTSSTLSTDTVSSNSLLTAYKGKGNAYISVEGLQQFSEPANLTLYNVLGMKVLSREIQNPSQKEMLSTVGMKTGVYILKVQAENIVFTKKLVIE